MASVQNPRYNANGTIDCDVYHELYGWIPFTASPDDTELHGRVIYEAITAGNYGDIAEYVKSEEEFISDALLERNRRISDIDRIATNPILWGALTIEEQKTLSDNRSALMEIEKQEGYPQTIIWPEKPEFI